MFSQFRSTIRPSIYYVSRNKYIRSFNSNKYNEPGNKLKVIESELDYINRHISLIHSVEKEKLSKLEDINQSTRFMARLIFIATMGFFGFKLIDQK